MLSFLFLIFRLGNYALGQQRGGWGSGWGWRPWEPHHPLRKGSLVYLHVLQYFVHVGISTCTCRNSTHTIDERDNHSGVLLQDGRTLARARPRDATKAEPARGHGVRHPVAASQVGLRTITDASRRTSRSRVPPSSCWAKALAHDAAAQQQHDGM